MDKLTKLWLGLIVLTIFAFLVGWLNFISDTMLIILLLTTFMKGQIVIDYFMDLSEVEGKYRFIPTIWLGVIIFLIGIIYYI
ncbi:MAG: cytochrome C oxidase subunit IV family protein [Arcobacteraceae bacterium]|nr:cytochrome C oxidase subunit IV family protein [Arcobacteraceae bacterium]